MRESRAALGGPYFLAPDVDFLAHAAGAVYSLGENGRMSDKTAGC